MKRAAIVFCLSILVSLAATTAGAESIRGKIGLTGRIGFIWPANNEVSVAFPGPAPVGPFGALADIKTDVGYSGGGGLIYGIDDRFAADMEITHSVFSTNGPADASTTDISFGAQYRFDQWRAVIPYAGAGLDILLNDFSIYNIDTSVGIHVKGGVDYFFTKNMALNGEVKIVVAPTADMDLAGVKVGNFDPSSLVGSVGIRYFF